MLLVMSWVVYELTDSALLLSLFTAARLAPSFLSPLFGAIGDRVNRKALLIVGTTLQMFLTAALSFLITTNLIQFWQLILIGFLEGMTQQICFTTAYALTADIVEPKDLTNAVALKTVAMGSTRVIGPAAGGILIGSLGAGISAWIATGVFVFAILAIFGIRQPTHTRASLHPQASVWHDLAEGFMYILHHKDMLAILAITLSYNIFLAPVHQALLPIFAKDVFKQGAEAFGFLATAQGAGALVGSLVIASLGNFKWKGWLYLGGTFLCAVFFVAFALAPTFALGLTFLAIAGLAGTGFMTMQATLMLVLAPEEMRARCMGFQNMAIGVYTFGSIWLGAFAQSIGVAPATAISNAILAVIIIIAIAIPNLRRM